MSRSATGTVEWRGTPARWWARLTTPTEDGGTRRVWHDLGRPDLANTVEDKRTAKRIALKRAKLASKKTYVGRDRAAAPKVTLGELEDKWFALLDGATEMKPATRSALKSCWRANIKPKLGAHAVAAITVPLLRAWIRDLKADLSASAVRNSAAALTRLLTTAKAEHWVALTSNPMRDEDVRSELPTVLAPDSDEIEYWTRPAFEALLASPSLSDVWFGLLLVDVVTGLRAGELHGLEFRHVQDAAVTPHLKIRQQLGCPREGEPVTLGTPKTKYGKRDVPLHPTARTWLAWWREHGWERYTGRKPEDDDFVFPNEAGEPWRPHSPKKLRDHLATAGLPIDFVSPDGDRSPFTWHALRHTFATWLGHNGVNGEVVDQLLGQSPRSVRGRHYQAPGLLPLAVAVGTLELTLPARSGVAESSCESSQAAPPPAASSQKTTRLHAVGDHAMGAVERSW